MAFLERRHGLQMAIWPEAELALPEGMDAGSGPA
jgi:hypothetical protein